MTTLKCSLCDNDIPFGFGKPMVEMRHGHPICQECYDKDCPICGRKDQDHTVVDMMNCRDKAAERYQEENEL